MESRECLEAGIAVEVVAKVEDNCGRRYEWSEPGRLLAEADEDRIARLEEDMPGRRGRVEVRQQRSECRVELGIRGDAAELLSCGPPHQMQKGADREGHNERRGS
eukprot:1017581-Prymnesium_polylepis.1